MTELEKRLNRFLRKRPTLGRGAYIAAGAVVLGDVTLGAHSSVWYNAVLRADINRIVIGHHTNIQDNSVLHLENNQPCVVGNYVTVGHGSILHACRVGDEALIGMGSVVLDGAVVGKQSIIGARTLVTKGMQIPAGSLVLGVPGKVVSPLTAKERAALKGMAEKYASYAAYCLNHRINVSAPLPS